ncbi:DUF6518 family protein [Actinoplanes sp. TRM 88003]|uniref:DUF6518 family protein n=1 Tax=Paractinoplanes aksuensis TaxID=2939490 RepID=A0ABT1DTM6_9ACTN|nr:DUF6518 family protein [Actinoplanes aksuensis]MCO8274205.1 DUF6518 family protein [Actinoplanes aksuensis]
MSRLLGVIAVALLFGALAALVKGHHDGVRDTIGNLSTPWLLIALAAGLHARTRLRGAVLGLIATGAALLGFYVVVAVTADDGHLVHVLRENRRWLFSGLVSGPVLGAFGAWLNRRATDVPRAVTTVIALLLILEPLVIVSARIVPGWREVIHWHLSAPVYIAEAVLGIALLGLALWSSRLRSGPTSTPS